MGNRVRKIEPYISKYTIERNAYRLTHEDKIVHLRLLSPDAGKTHIEYYSYIIPRGIDVLTTKIENEIIEAMELRMHEKLGNKLGILEHKTKALNKQIQSLNIIQNKIEYD